MDKGINEGKGKGKHNLLGNLVVTNVLGDQLSVVEKSYCHRSKANNLPPPFPWQRTCRGPSWPVVSRRSMMYADSADVTEGSREFWVKKGNFFTRIGYKASRSLSSTTIRAWAWAGAWEDKRDPT